MATHDLTISIPSIKSLKKDDILNCPYSGTYKELTLPKGQYKLECWGAQGGTAYGTAIGGYGGYSKGILTLDDITILYLYSGGQGAAGFGSLSGGFNGGGNAYVMEQSSAFSEYQNYSGAGGGGTDIRIGQDSLYARVIVAGGGGGSYSYPDGKWYSNGGVGGGTQGGTGTSPSPNNYYPGTGGTQNAAGKSYNRKTQESSSTNGILASFGVGGSCKQNLTRTTNGGGGGWYGGGYSYQASAGGGSGYVYTELTASNYPSGCLLTSSYYLTEAETIAGNQTIPLYSGGTGTGNSGNGVIRITIIDIESYNLYIKNSSNSYIQPKDIYVKTQNNLWTPISSIYVKTKSDTWTEI